jgi:alpha-tubulin suppressor-like RCC1 family protein
MGQSARRIAVAVLVVTLVTAYDLAGATSAPKTRARQIEAGGYFSCALLAMGTVQCWGYNQDDENGNGSTRNSSRPQIVANIDNVIKISAGWDSACALESSSHVYCWGSDTYGQLGNGEDQPKDSPQLVPGLSDVSQISVGGGLRADVTPHPRLLGKRN